MPKVCPEGNLIGRSVCCNGSLEAASMRLRSSAARASDAPVDVSGVVWGCRASSRHEIQTQSITNAPFHRGPALGNVTAQIDSNDHVLREFDSRLENKQRQISSFVWPCIEPWTITSAAQPAGGGRRRREEGWAETEEVSPGGFECPLNTKSPGRIRGQIRRDTRRLSFSRRPFWVQPSRMKPCPSSKP